MTRFFQTQCASVAWTSGSCFTPYVITVQMNQAAEALFDDRRFTPLSQSRVIEIALLSVADLGSKRSHLSTVDRASARVRFGRVPLELGPHLRVQFPNQPEGSVGLPKQHRAPFGAITVASTPLDDCDETPKGFYLRRIDGVLWLRGYWSWPGHIWSPEDVLVFSRG